VSQSQPSQPSQPLPLQELDDAEYERQVLYGNGKGGTVMGVIQGPKIAGTLPLNHAAKFFGADYAPVKPPHPLNWKQTEAIRITEAEIRLGLIPPGVRLSQQLVDHQRQQHQK
jgi:hypothetical protein